MAQNCAKQWPAHKHIAAYHGPLALLHHSKGWQQPRGCGSEGDSASAHGEQKHVGELPGPASTTGQHLGVGCAVSSYACAQGSTRAPLTSQEHEQHPRLLLNLNRNTSEVSKAEARLLGSHSTWTYLMLNFNRMPQCCCAINYWKSPHTLSISLKISFCWPLNCCWKKKNTTFQSHSLVCEVLEAVLQKGCASKATALIVIKKIYAYTFR